jgi:hypothetical protein
MHILDDIFSMVLRIGEVSYANQPAFPQKALRIL